MGLDLAETLIGESLELTADDLIAGPKLLRITKIEITDDPKRRVAIFYEGDEGKPYRPCLTMRRVLAGCFGANADDYIGQTIEVYRDSEVVYGKQKVGGVRIRRASIEKTVTIMVQVSRGKKAPWTVHPLPESTAPASAPAGAPARRSTTASPPVPRSALDSNPARSAWRPPPAAPASALPSEQLQATLQLIAGASHDRLVVSRQRADEMLSTGELNPADHEQFVAAIEARQAELAGATETTQTTETVS